MPQNGKIDLLFGIHSVFEAIQAKKRKLHELLISEKKLTARLDKIIQAAKKDHIKIEYANTDLLDKLTKNARHQGIVAKASVFPVQNAVEVVSFMEKKQEPCFILVVENMEDPHNLGALIRTALCAGVDCIMIPKDRSVTPSPSVSRSSAGAMEHANIFMITNTATILRTLKKKNTWVAGLDARGDTPLYKSDLRGDLVLVIGGEHKGIRPLVRKECDFLISIPMSGTVNSLNASVAGGIEIYEAHRQRTLK